MTTETTSLGDYAAAVQRMSELLASGWSEAAQTFADRVAQEGGQQAVAMQRQYEILAGDLGEKFRTAANTADDWAQAARASNNEAVARVYDRYAQNYYEKANNLLDTMVDKKAALDGLAREAKAAASLGDQMLGGSFGRALGPAFDAAQMAAGALDWANTGNSDKFGGAAMGVALAGGFGIIVGGLATALALPVVVVAVAAGAAAIFGSALGDLMYSRFRDSVNDFFLGARNFVWPRDPLVLDLDGDGLELAGASGSIIFDHDADGIKTGTGWARPDDGFLVRDLNGNGTIDTGRELFGVDTLKSNGSLATHGFDALSDLDTNGDGFITSADAAFGELQIWQDANQDGVSQTGELKTLASLNITSIGVGGANTGPQAGQVINNNLVALSTTFKRDGQSQTVGAIDLETNKFISEFPPEVVDEEGNTVAITPQAQALPQMNGSGMVRSMRAAASLDSDFAAALQTFAATTTRDGQRSQLDNLIDKWADTADFPGGLLVAMNANVTYNMPSGITALEYKHLVNVLEAF
ncbi:MAG: hypothetical protein Q8M96_11875, partial [Rubrivivax sp.]|nr:hypothetical protein [Rubrivivax sp.]